jgi:hypothetical protein
MKKIILIVTVLSILGFSIKAHAATMICQTMSGQQFVWVGNMCPAGSIFISY